MNKFIELEKMIQEISEGNFVSAVLPSVDLASLEVDDKKLSNDEIKCWAEILAHDLVFELKKKQ